MICPNCRAESAGGYKFCPRCGYQYDLSAQRPLQMGPAPARKDDSKLMLIVAVVVIIMVVVPIILAAAMYFMVLGFGGTDGDEFTPAVQISGATINDGKKFTLSQPSTDVVWSDVSFTLSDSTGSAVSWTPMNNEWALVNSTRIYAGGPSLLGEVIVWFNVTDLVGLGFLWTGDYLTVTTGFPYQFSPSTTYYLALIFVPTGQALGSLAFNF